jgi:hypothetical protein
MVIISAVVPATLITAEFGKWQVIATLEYQLSAFLRNYFFIRNCAIMPPTRQFGYKRRKLSGVKLV